MTSEIKDREVVTMSPMLIMLIRSIQEESNKRIASAIELGAREIKAPEKTQADLTNYVWIFPPKT